MKNDENICILMRAGLYWLLLDLALAKALRERPLPPNLEMFLFLFFFATISFFFSSWLSLRLSSFFVIVERLINEFQSNWGNCNEQIANPNLQFGASRRRRFYGELTNGLSISPTLKSCTQPNKRMWKFLE
jgi:hypothetical protein